MFNFSVATPKLLKNGLIASSVSPAAKNALKKWQQFIINLFIISTAAAAEMSFNGNRGIASLSAP